MKRLLAGFFPTLIIACSAASQPTAPAPIASVAIVSSARPVASSSAPQPKPMARASLPQNPALTVSVNSSHLNDFLRKFAAGIPEQSRTRAEIELGLSPGVLVSGRVAAALGVDTSRPLLVAIAGVDREGLAILAETQALLGVERSKPGEKVARELDRILRSHKGISTHLRVLVPSIEPELLFRSREQVLESGRWRSVQAPPELRGVFTKQERAILLSVADGYGIIDVYQTVGDLNTAKIVSELAISHFKEQRLEENWQELGLEGHGAKARFFPGKLAQLAALETTVQAHEYARKGREEQRDRQVAAALTEREANLSLGSNHGVEWVKSAELELDVNKGFPSVVMRAELGQASFREGPSGWDLAQSVDLGEALARFDIATAAMKSFGAPGDPEGGALQESRYQETLDQTNWLGFLSALPMMALGATRTPLHWDAGVDGAAILRFERFGWANPAFGEPDVFWGLLPKGASGETVACAIEKKPSGCAGKRRLRAGGVLDLGGSYGRLLTVGGRQIVLTSKDKKAVSQINPKLSAAPVAAMRGTISSASVKRFFDGLQMTFPQRKFLGEAKIEGHVLTVRVRPEEDAKATP